MNVQFIILEILKIIKKKDTWFKYILANQTLLNSFKSIHY